MQDRDPQSNIHMGSRYEYGTGSATLSHHRLQAGEQERQARLLQRNADTQARFGTDLRGAYAAVAAQTPLAAGAECIMVSEPGVKGWWVTPRGAAFDRVILFIHGGGYRLGDAASYRGLASQLAIRTGVPVFSLDYPLTPEHPFPAAYDAAEAALVWLAYREHRQISLVGDSAGGGLALALLGVAMSEVRPASVVVFSPWTDLALTGRSFHDPATRDPIFEPSVLTALADAYLSGADPRDGRASPLYAIPDNLPPITIQVGSEELLLDDSRRYAEYAAQRGGEVALDIFDGMHHVFQRDVGVLETASTALDMAAQFVATHWRMTDR